MTATETDTNSAKNKEEEEGNDDAKKTVAPSPADSIRKPAKNVPSKVNDGVDHEDIAAAAYHYTIFSLLFMIGFMIHCRKYYDKNLLLTMAHIFVFIISSSEPDQQHQQDRHRFQDATFLSFLVFCIYSTIESSPYNANHHNVMGFASLLLLPQQIRRVFQSSAAYRHQATVDALNALRWAIVIMYFMAGFHKINDDFLFDIEVSCAFDMFWKYWLLFGLEEYEDLAKLPKFMKYLPFLGLIVEIAPPIILCFSRTQKWGVLLLVTLHWSLLPVGFADFGSIAQSFLWLFVAPKRIINALPFHYYTDMAACFLFFEVVAYISIFVHGEDDGGLENEEAAMVFLAYGIHWISVMRAEGLDDGVSLKRPKSLLSLLALGGFVFFAMNQYLGLRTSGTLTMFSNLRTEGATSNHLLLRSNPIKFFGYQEDVVKVLELDEVLIEEDILGVDYYYQKLVFDRELKRGRERWEEDSPLRMKVEYQGQIYETDDVLNDPSFEIFRQEESWFSKKYFDFRDIQPTDYQDCEW